MRHASLALILAALAAAAPVTAQARGHAVLRLAGRQPLELKGAGFRARERVRVAVRRSGRATVVRHVRAGGSGRFDVSFGGLSAPCGDMGAKATGSLGSRAVLTGMKFPDCIVR